MYRSPKPGPSFRVDQTASDLAAALAAHRPAAKPLIVITSAKALLSTGTRIGVLLAAALLARPALLQAATPVAAGGITLAAYEIDGGPAEIDGWRSPGTISVDFVNERETPATFVRFAFVGDDAKTHLIDDVGTFSPNVHIRHTFHRAHAADDGDLSIVAVRWADGSAWIGSSEQPIPRRQESVGR